MYIIIGATGIIMRGLRKNLEVVPGNHSVESMPAMLDFRM
jgi:hypothetical protein